MPVIKYVQLEFGTHQLKVPVTVAEIEKAKLLGLAVKSTSDLLASRMGLLVEKKQSCGPSELVSGYNPKSEVEFDGDPANLASKESMLQLAREIAELRRVYYLHGAAVPSTDPEGRQPIYQVQIDGKSVWIFNSDFLDDFKKETKAMGLDPVELRLRDSRRGSL